MPHRLCRLSGRNGVSSTSLEDARLELDTNPVESAIRPVAMPGSYYTSSSNARKQGLLVFHFDATLASVTRKLGYFVLFQVRRSYLMRRIRNNLLGRKHPFLDQPADTMAETPSFLAASVSVSHSPFFSADR